MQTEKQTTEWTVIADDGKVSAMVKVPTKDDYFIRTLLVSGNNPEQVEIVYDFVMSVASDSLTRARIACDVFHGLVRATTNGTLRIEGTNNI